MISKTPDLLIRTLQESIDQKSASLKKQILALEELFSMFTTERPQMRRTSYLDIPKYRNAYLRYHVPLNFARASCALTQVRKVYPEVDRLEEIVDLGAGPGSSGKRSATLFEQAREPVAAGEEETPRKEGGEEGDRKQQPPAEPVA